MAAAKYSLGFMTCLAVAWFGTSYAEPPATPTKSQPKRPAVPAKQLSNRLGMSFVLIPPGSFLMGSPQNEPERDPIERQHRVTLSRGFYLQTTEVTQGQWKAVMAGQNPAGFLQCGDACPVDALSWDLIQAFLAKINQLDKDKTYRLPTEAEWEYAARAGTTTPFFTGKCLSTRQANINGETPMPGCPVGPFSLGPVKVASYAPNAWGLHDMHGNVWEMTQDWFGPYPENDATDPTGPANGEYHVVRGASWRMDPKFARSANRFQSIRDFAGLRLVLVLRN
jgi:formylglycine-generating enzyme required for sulfatase activity